MERHELRDGWSVDSVNRVQHDTQREVAAGLAALAALLCSPGFEKVTVVFEQPPAT
jgi:hypothetical protein